AAAIAALPLPVATSSTRQPAWRSAVSHRCSAWKTIREATTEKSPLAQVLCCRPFTAAKPRSRPGPALSGGLMCSVLKGARGRSIKSTIDRSLDSTYGRAIMSRATDRVLGIEPGGGARGDVEHERPGPGIGRVGRGKASGAEAEGGRRGEPSRHL